MSDIKITQINVYAIYITYNLLLVIFWMYDQAKLSQGDHRWLLINLGVKGFMISISQKAYTH